MTDLTRPVTIRLAYGEDAIALARLAVLDSAPRVPAAPVLVAESEGELRAALSLVDGFVVADPFQPTAALVALLRTHAAAGEKRERRPLARHRLRLA